MCGHLPGLRELERISSDAFADRVNKIIDKINESETPIVIEHRGREYLLLPASMSQSNCQGKKGLSHERAICD